jgi:hypothetical protein
MINAVDSYFEYVANRMATIVNPARKVVGVSDAMDWPPKTVLFEAFYLLVLGQKPVIGKSFWSAAIPVLVHTLQWTWMIQGTDLSGNKVGRSRGDRYRTNMKMRQELLKATYPWFCQKQEWSVQGTTPSGLALQGTPVVPSEFVWWSPLTFLNRIDSDPGLIYGAATVQLTDMTEMITA